MPEKFNGLIPQEEWIDVGFQVTRPNDPLDGLVGDLRTNNIIAKWQPIAAEYQTEKGANGIMSITIRPRGESGSPAYYTVENREGKRLYGDDLISIDEPFTYLSLLNGDLVELRVRFYSDSREELYAAEFDTANLKLIKTVQ